MNLVEDKSRQDESTFQSLASLEPFLPHQRWSRSSILLVPVRGTPSEHPLDPSYS